MAARAVPLLVVLPAGSVKVHGTWTASYLWSGMAENALVVRTAILVSARTAVAAVCMGKVKDARRAIQVACAPLVLKVLCWRPRNIVNRTVLAHLVV